LSPIARTNTPPTRNAATTAMKRKEQRPSSARHQNADVCRFRRRRIDFARDAALVDHEQAIGQRHHFLELRRDEQDRAAGVPQLDQLAVDELDGADVHATGGLRDEKQPGLQLELAADDELLLIAAGQRPRGQIEIRRAARRSAG
jgi:hypothetical protein